MKSLFLTDCGQIRQHNEDAGGIFLNQADQVLAIIADGMGGHLAGDVASQMTVSVMKDTWENLNELLSPIEAESWLKQTIKAINKQVYHRSQVEHELKGMGTTLVVAIITEEFVSIAHIGDSRFYIYNKSGFTQVTEDHSLVNALLNAGEITPQDAKNHPRRNVISRALGTDEEVEVDVHSLSIESEEKFLLCTDGLTDKISNEELEEHLNRLSSLEDIGQSLVDLANQRGGEDNISLILISNCSDGKVGEILCS